MYDAGLYDPQEEEDEVRASELLPSDLVPFVSCCVVFMKDLCVFLYFQGFSDFLEEMLSLMAQARREVMLLNTICRFYITILWVV